MEGRDTMAEKNTSKTLCVAMIVRDAEQLVIQTLDNVKSIADHVVIGDTGSLDGTIAAAEQRGAQVSAFEWQDDFSAARNHCLAQATGDWVLWLDAGETLEKREADAIRDFVDNQSDPNKAYMLLIKQPRGQNDVAAEQVGSIRLVPRREGLAFSGRVRETLTASLEAVGIEIDGLPWRIHRPECDAEPRVKALKAHRNLTLGEREAREVGPQPRLLNCLGDALQNMGQGARAAQCFRESLAICAAGSPEMLEAYYGLLTSLDDEPNAAAIQLSVCVEAVETFPLDAQLLCAMGGYLQAQGRIDLACRSYQTSCQYGQVNPQVWHLENIAEVAASCYCLSLQVQEKDDEAIDGLQQALEQHPASVRLRRQLMDLYVKLGRKGDALAQLALLPPDLPHREVLKSAVRGACLAAEKNWISAAAYLRAAHSAGCRDPLCLRWLTICLIATEEVDEARKVVQQWQEVDPGNPELPALRQSLGLQVPSPAGPRVRIDDAKVAPQTEVPHLDSSAPISSSNTVQ